jgi:hypothetical protein
VPVGERGQFLLPIGADPDDHQRAHPVSVQAHAEVDAVHPDVDVVHAGQFAAGEVPVFLLPGLGQPGDRRRGQPRPGAEELLQRRHEVLRAQPVQVQQRQHLSHLRRPAAPRRQDQAAEPLLSAGGRVGALVVHPRRPDPDRARHRGHLSRPGMPVAHHQPRLFSSRSPACAAMHAATSSSSATASIRRPFPHDLIQAFGQVLARSLVSDYLQAPGTWRPAISTGPVDQCGGPGSRHPATG